MFMMLSCNEEIILEQVRQTAKTYSAISSFDSAAHSWYIRDKFKLMKLENLLNYSYLAKHFPLWSLSQLAIHRK